MRIGYSPHSYPVRPGEKELCEVFLSAAPKACPSPHSGRPETHKVVDVWLLLFKYPGNETILCVNYLIFEEVNMNNNDQVKNAEKEAVILLNQAMALAKASMSNNEHEIIRALDSNLKLWVEIETSLKSAKNLLPEDIKANLMKLSKFVERMILSKGLKMTKTDFDCLVNINMQISEGLIEAVKNNLAREEAFSLLKCAVDLSNARENNSTSDLISALDNNMKLWVYIKTLASDEKNPLPRETKGNLIKLADYVSSRTLEVGKNVDNLNQKALDCMIMTNLQISEGLMSKRPAC